MSSATSVRSALALDSVFLGVFEPISIFWSMAPPPCYTRTSPHGVTNRTAARTLPCERYVATHSHPYVLLGTDVKDTEAWRVKYFLDEIHAIFPWPCCIEGWSVCSVDLRQS